MVALPESKATYERPAYPDVYTLTIPVADCRDFIDKYRRTGVIFGDVVVVQQVRFSVLGVVKGRKRPKWYWHNVYPMDPLPRGLAAGDLRVLVQALGAAMQSELPDVFVHPPPINCIEHESIRDNRLDQEVGRDDRGYWVSLRAIVTEIRANGREVTNADVRALMAKHVVSENLVLHAVRTNSGKWAQV